MRKQGDSELKPLEIDAPEGITVSVGEASRILGTSRSTLKRRASEWGLRTFWDGRGRRYSLKELEEVKGGVLKPRAPATTTLDLESIRGYSIPGGYRFRVYRTGADRGYLGYFASEKYDDVISWLSYTFGAGTYYLKLLDERNMMTGYNFIADVYGPLDEESRRQLEELEVIRTFTRIFRSQIRQMKKWDQEHEGK